MTRSAARHLTIAAIAMMAAMSARTASAESPDAHVHLLNVPYLPQSESLCGGAAIAMLMRYWGATNVYAETFADLVDPVADGIHGTDLLAALRSRGWAATSFRGTAASVKASLAATRPVVALIEDRPGRFHYVVVVGWVPGRVIVHDPARAPFRILDEHTFQESWKASDYWSLVASPTSSADLNAVPADRSTLTRVPSELHPSREVPCSDVVDEGVRLARTDDAAGARRLFELAAATCPNASGPWREMAGLHALVGEWALAAADARRALARDASDAHAARILATALYLSDDTDDALDAWNRVGEPALDLINIDGLERTRFPVVTKTIGLEPQMLVTRRSLIAARRRLTELPAVEVSRISLIPGERGQAEINAAVIERPLFPRSAVSIATMGVRAVTDREALVTIASPSGGGEVWTASWRWWEHRPRVAFGFESPSPFGGVWGVGLFDERQSYESTGGLFEESRRRADFHVSNWTVGGIRWEGSVAVDRFDETPAVASGQSFGAAASVQRRWLDDRAFIETRTGVWTGAVESWTVAVGGEWRSNPHREGNVLIGRAVDARAGSSAPLALWPGAGAGQGREGLLRAHPLIDDGIIRDAVFGRHVINGGIEWQRWAQLAGKPMRVAPAAFVDVGRAYRGLESTNDRCQYDVGAGLRLAVPGSGVLRIDVAHGLRDGRTVVSMGWGK